MRSCRHNSILKQLQDGGATLIMHGLTHRMPKHKFNLCAWPMAYGFARGQSEFYYSTESQAKTSLAASQSIMEKAGFSSAAKRFIPPAWLLSRACLVAVRQADYEFYELLDGIHWHDRVLAPRLIGWGSLTAIESHLTSTWAHLKFSSISPRHAACDSPSRYVSTSFKKIFGASVVSNV